MLCMMEQEQCQDGDKRLGKAGDDEQGCEPGGGWVAGKGKTVEVAEDEDEGENLEGNGEEVGVGGEEID